MKQIKKFFFLSFAFRKNEFGGNSNRDRAMNYDNGPGMSIDTWTNDVAEEPKKESSFGSACYLNEELDIFLSH